MILDLGSIPVHARRAFADEHGIFFDLSPDLGPTRAREHVALEASAPEGPPWQSAPRERQAGSLARGGRGFAVQPLQALLALTGIVLLTSMGPTATGCAASARPPAVPPGVAATSSAAGADAWGSPLLPGRSVPAVETIVAELDDLQLRAAIVVRRLELADRRLLAMDAAWALDASCPVGIEWLSVATSNEVKGRCRRGPSVGLAPVPTFAGKGAGLETLARSSSPQPGVVAESGGAGPSGGGR